MHQQINDLSLRPLQYKTSAAPLVAERDRSRRNSIPRRVYMAYEYGNLKASCQLRGRVVGDLSLTKLADDFSKGFIKVLKNLRIFKFIPEKCRSRVQEAYRNQKLEYTQNYHAGEVLNSACNIPVTSMQGERSNRVKFVFHDLELMRKKDFRPNLTIQIGDPEDAFKRGFRGWLYKDAEGNVYQIELEVDLFSNRMNFSETRDHNRIKISQGDNELDLVLR